MKLKKKVKYIKMYFIVNTNTYYFLKFSTKIAI